MIKPIGNPSHPFCPDWPLNSQAAGMGRHRFDSAPGDGGGRPPGGNGPPYLRSEWGKDFPVALLFGVLAVLVGIAYYSLDPVLLLLILGHLALGAFWLLSRGPLAQRLQDRRDPNRGLQAALSAPSNPFPPCSRGLGLLAPDDQAIWLRGGVMFPIAWLVGEETLADEFAGDEPSRVAGAESSKPQQLKHPETQAARDPRPAPEPSVEPASHDMPEPASRHSDIPDYMPCMDLPSIYLA